MEKTFHFAMLKKFAPLKTELICINSTRPGCMMSLYLNSQGCHGARKACMDP